MIKVVIADDEERICQLIRALIDWEAMGLELAGFAHNGLEAAELAEKLKPDILITDIRMPGISGVELIQRLKEKNSDLEIIVISGYAHFEYAQQAIKYGVGDYLLKPVSKAELTATLEKLRQRICNRREDEQDKEELRRKAEKDVRRMRSGLLQALLDQTDLPLSIEVLRENYYLQVSPGIFQAFWLKMDCAQDSLSDSSALALMEKAQSVLERGLKSKCFEMVSAVKEFSCVGIMNYARGRQEEIRKILKGCLSQMELQRGLFDPVSFSMSAGGAFESPELLQESMKEASVLIQDRIVKGTGRLLEQRGTLYAARENMAREKYLREIANAVEALSTEQAEQAVKHLLDEVRRMRDVRGREIFELVDSAAEIFSACTQMPERAKRLAEFRRRYEQCSSTEELFRCLGGFQNEYIEECRAQRENDAVRPVRKAKQYIQNHYSEPITLEEVSEIVGLSSAYFSVLFKKTEGEGFAKYLINVRMEQAKILLRESNISVADICRQVGYNDLKHFTHTFEKAVGVRPATYRKLYG